MKKGILFIEAIKLIMIGGLLLFSVGFFLPAKISLQGATLIGGVIGYVIFFKVANLYSIGQSTKDIFLFCTTLAMSLWASICLLGTCSVFPELSQCSENKAQGFVALNFFFPMLVVFFSWVATRWSR